ncbi:unnamed protein product [Moneuplotes crassus]|uniref:Uncharacterized protein n=1 Tax=Euplotes crassus TaxID=5936 RepID=A0AAD1XK51_EUPCR|nr:unnamed protein product [Moneuplotes crassus]
MKVLNNKRGLKIKKDLFNNKPNLSLRGCTFDVNHLHKFITSGGMSSPLGSYPKMTKTPAPKLKSVKSQPDTSALFTRTRYSRGLSQQRNRSSKIIGSEFMTNIRPSSTFLSVPRYTTAYLIGDKANFYTSVKEPTRDPDSVESEIANFDSDKAQRKTALGTKNKILSDLGSMYNNTIPLSPQTSNFLMSPKERRKEVKEMKEKLSQYLNLKEQAMFVNKRNRQLKYGYRDNIRDQIIRPKTTNNFFSSRKPQKTRDGLKTSKNARYRRRLQIEKTGTNSQIEFFCDQKTSKGNSSKQPVVDIAIGWNRKKEPQVRQPSNTFNNVFNM